MKGHIYIKGQIGNTLNEDGEIALKGVELQDVVTQVESQKDVDSFDVHINSPGGIVEIGKAIADYLKSLDQDITTIGEDIVGSIATVIHLAAPVANRKLIAGTEYFIHNPLVENVSGDASKLEAAAEYVKAYEKDLLSIYDKSVTADKEAIKLLMAIETSLTDDQAVTLGFVGEVIPKVELSAVAIMGRKAKKLEPSKNFLNIDYKELKSNILAIVKAAMPKQEENPNVKAGMVVTDKGDLEYGGEAELPKEGDAVTIGGEPAPEGDYTLTDGTVIKVDAESNVTEVVSFEEPDEEVEALKAEVKRMKAEKLETEKATEQVINEKIEEIKKGLGSDFIPVAEVPGFRERKATATKVGDIRQDAQDRKDEYIKK